MFNSQVEHELDIIDDAELKAQEELTKVPSAKEIESLANELELDNQEAEDFLDDLSFLDDMGINPLDLI